MFINSLYICVHLNIYRSTLKKCLRLLLYLLIGLFINKYVSQDVLVFFHNPKGVVARFGGVSRITFREGIHIFNFNVFL